MKIMILNGSPRPNGNTSAMVDAFAKGASDKGHETRVFQVGRMKIGGCLACEYCHNKGEGNCIQKDEMQQIYDAYDDIDMLVIASPIYNFSMSGQMHTTLNRFYAKKKPEDLARCAMFLSSESDGVYGSALMEYQAGMLGFMQLKNEGVVVAHGEQNKSKELMDALYNLGYSLEDTVDKISEESENAVR